VAGPSFWTVSNERVYVGAVRPEKNLESDGQFDTHACEQLAATGPPLRQPKGNYVNSFRLIRLFATTSTRNAPSVIQGTQVCESRHGVIAS
jgi:hypothetical protein